MAELEEEDYGYAEAPGYVLPTCDKCCETEMQPK